MLIDIVYTFSNIVYQNFELIERMMNVFVCSLSGDKKSLLLELLPVDGEEQRATQT